MRKEIEDAWFEWFNNQDVAFMDQEPEVISKQAYEAGYKAAQQSVQRIGGNVCADCGNPEDLHLYDCPHYQPANR